MNKQEYRELVEEYFAGEITEEDCKEVGTCSCIVYHSTDDEMQVVIDKLVDKGLIYSLDEVNNGCGEHTYPMTDQKYYELKKE